MHLAQRLAAVVLTLGLSGLSRVWFPFKRNQPDCDSTCL